MSETVTRLSDDLAEIVDATGPMVARIEARRRLPASGIIWSGDGVIVTAHHVVEHTDNIRVGLSDGRTVAATLVGRDPTTDVAVLRADSKDLVAPAWSEAESARVGHLVLALGRPGASTVATLGIVSAQGEGWRTPAGGRLDSYLQTDVVMYPGLSGGPLVDSAGQILGLNTSALLRGISITVPKPTLDRVVGTLLSEGRIRRGYLGVGAQTVRLPAGIPGLTDQETGLILVSVEPNSPAEKGGLLLGDTIIVVGNQPTRQVDDLLNILSAETVGESLAIRIIRGGEPLELSVVVGERE